VKIFDKKVGLTETRRNQATTASTSLQVLLAPRIDCPDAVLAIEITFI
jgi:hypothetical protein